MGLSRLFGGRRLGLAATLIAATFILASAAMPFGHHSVECHLTSPTHCTSCTIGAGGRVAQNPSALVALPWRDAGPALAAVASAPQSPAFLQISDRAPPVNG
jgi:hypothetical protein